MKVNSYMKVVIICIMLGIGVNSMQGANIIFDMNGVLVHRQRTFWEIGPGHFLGFLNPLHFFNPLKIEQELYMFLDLLAPRAEGTPVVMHKNRLLPKLMCDWQAGLLSNQEMLMITDRGLQEHKDFFSNHGKRNLMKAIMHFMFDAERFAKCMKPIKRGKHLIEACLRQKNPDGSRRNRVFILSNWDRESFIELQKNPHINSFLSECDGIIISGAIHYLKPEDAMFNYLFETYGIDPHTQETIYIDDEEINITGADSLQKAQLTNILCKDIKKVKKILIAKGIISKKHKKAQKD
jgi:FMN phosphatase YigB (HAD superfamily)